MYRITLVAISFLCLSAFLADNTEAANSTGDIQVAFILSEFSNQAYQEEHDQDYFDDLAFGETNSMHDYFDEVSRSQLNFQGTVYGPYTLIDDAEDYGTENSDFVRDSVDIADEYIDFRDYDAVVVVHSGPGEESSGNSDDIWSVHWPSISISTDDDGFVIKKISQVPEYQSTSAGEKNPLGVWCHEFGHEIGLPDLYDTDGSSSGIGDWGVMASGSWGNYGETPTYMNAWSRYELGWAEPIVINYTEDIKNLEMEPIENNGNIYLLPIPGNWSNSKEYYLLENRQQIKYDEYLPGSGLLIWHIDEDIIDSKWNSNTINDDENHKGVDLEEADGLNHLDSKTNYGDENDPYNSGSFTKDTNPNSLAYNGTESGWRIENIEVSGLNIIIDISFLSKPHAVADADEAVITEGAELQFYGNESLDEDGSIVNYTWNFDDGEYSYIDNPTHIFTTNGSYDVSLTVCDNNNLCDSVILNIFVNKPPIAVVEISNLTIYLGEVILFNATDSYDIDGSIEFYYWNFDDGYTSNQAEIEHEYQNSGFYNVSLKVIDNLNDITTVYYNIEVINQLPLTSFEFNPMNGNTLIIFNFIDLSSDFDGEVNEWLWNFGDGNTSILQNPSHNFSLPGNYSVNLTVTDDQGGTNFTTNTVTVENSLPFPRINIKDGINIGQRSWAVSADKIIEIDGSVTFDNENDELEYIWNIEGNEYLGEKQTHTFNAGEYIITLQVIDSRGGERIESFTINAESIPLLSLDYSQINLIVSEVFLVKSETSGGSLNMYNWEIRDIANSVVYEETSNNESLEVTFNEAGNYKLNVSGRDVETNLWTRNYPLDIFVYNNPIADFTFEDDSNEGEWMTFSGENSSGLELTYEWNLDGVKIAGENEIIDILIDTGGINTVGLTVNQSPVGSAYIEKQFYTNHKPTGILSTNPPDPRYGEDFEVYLAAYDVETEANIEYLKITVYNTNGDKAWENSYDNQGSNFNLVFEMQYTGIIVLDYKLIDNDGNKKTNTTSVNVRGWADIFVESFEANGSKEKGKKQTITIILTNFNETYQSKWYNGHLAKGKLELMINSEVIHTWDYSVNGSDSQEFNFEWIAKEGYYIFEARASISEGEVITSNNERNITVIIEGERSSGFLPSPGIFGSLILVIFVAITSRRKSN